MAGSSGEFYTLEQTMQLLRLSEERVRRLVEEGEIRGFREGSTMRFRRVEIDELVAALARQLPD